MTPTSVSVAVACSRTPPHYRIARSFRGCPTTFGMSIHRTRQMLWIAPLALLDESANRA